VGELVRIAAARREFAEFKNRLSIEISSLRNDIDTALAAGERARTSLGCSELFQQPSTRPKLWRLQPTRYRKRQTPFAA
jgi:hypothetical protein